MRKCSFRFLYPSAGGLVLQVRCKVYRFIAQLSNLALCSLLTACGEGGAHCYTFGRGRVGEWEWAEREVKFGALRPAIRDYV